MAFAIIRLGQEASILWAQDARGNRHLFDYNAQGWLTALHDAVGRTVTFGYDASGTLQSLSDWAGRTVSFQYDTQKLPGQPLLTRVVGANGATEAEYDYDSSGRVIAVRDAEGFQTDYTLNGRQVTQRSVQVRSVWGTYARVDLPPAPFVTRYSYTGDHLNGQTTITDALGQTTTFDIQNDTVPRIADAAGTHFARGFDNAGRETSRTDALGAKFQSPRNAQGAPTSVVDRAGRTTTLERDAWNNLTKITAPDGTIEQMSYTGGDDSTGQKRLLRSRTDALGQTTSYSYDARGWLLGTTDPLGHKTNWSYDTLGRPIKTTDALGNSTGQTFDAAGNALSNADAEGNVSKVTYDTGNRVKTVTDALSQVTTFNYDGLGNLTQITDALGGVRSYTTNVFGLVEIMTDELGQITRTAYDALGRAVAMTDALGHRTTMRYDAKGLLIATTVAAGELDLTTTIERDGIGQVVATTDAIGARTSYSLDVTGRIVSTTDALGAKTSYGYDALGRMVSSTDVLGNSQQTSYDTLGRVVAAKDALGHTTTMAYDAAGRLTSQTDALGHVTSFQYDAANRQTAIADALGNRSTTQYDRRGLPTVSIDPLGHQTEMRYDALGRVVATVDALGNQSSRTQYDALNRQVASFDALGNSTTFQYDAASRLTASVDAKGQTTRWTYNALNRVVQSLFADGSSVSYTFDAAGRQTAMQDGTGTTLTTFDAVGRETSVRYGSGHILSYAFDVVGNRTQMTDPDGGVTSYQYDLNGQLTQLTNPQGETTRFIYDGQGRVTQKSLANGVVETHTFDYVGQETNIVHRNSVGTTLASFTSAYDVAGRKTGVTEADGSAMGYTYDAGGQLLSETRSGFNAYTIAYTYDALGNRLTKTESGLVTSYSYDGANQLQIQETRNANGVLVSQGTANYDLNGNVTQQVEGGQTTSFLWNPQNYLVGVTHPDGTSENYTYCGEGIRRTKTGREGFRRFIRDGQNILLEVADTGGTLRRYTHKSDDWGTLLSLHQGQISRFYSFDGIANTRLLTDENGGVSDGYLYSAFGEERQVSGSTANPLRFGGEVGYYHDEAKRLYVRARHLDVNAGRWLSRDPLRNSYNNAPYVYDASQPVNNVDPDGMKSKTFPFHTTYTYSSDRSVIYVTYSDDYLKYIPKIKSATEKMFTSPRGKYFKNVILKRKTPLYIHVGEYCINEYKRNSAVWHDDPSVVSNGDGVFINPKEVDMILTKNNKGEVKLERFRLVALMAHEVGHEVTHISDDTSPSDPIGNNVRYNENPVRLWFGYPIRIRYR